MPREILSCLIFLCKKNACFRAVQKITLVSMQTIWKKSQRDFEWFRNRKWIIIIMKKCMRQCLRSLRLNMHVLVPVPLRPHHIHGEFCEGNRLSSACRSTDRRGCRRILLEHRPQAKQSVSWGCEWLYFQQHLLNPNDAEVTWKSGQKVARRSLDSPFDLVPTNLIVCWRIDVIGNFKRAHFKQDVQTIRMQ